MQKVRFAAIPPTPRPAGTSASSKPNCLAVRNLLFAIRALPGCRGTVQGRKVMLFLSSGFPMEPRSPVRLCRHHRRLEQGQRGRLSGGGDGPGRGRPGASGGPGRAGTAPRGSGGGELNPGAIQQVFNPLASHTGGVPHRQHQRPGWRHGECFPGDERKLHSGLRPSPPRARRAFTKSASRLTGRAPRFAPGRLRGIREPRPAGRQARGNP